MGVPVNASFQRQVILGLSAGTTNWITADVFTLQGARDGTTASRTYTGCVTPAALLRQRHSHSATQPTAPNPTHFSSPATAPTILIFACHSIHRPLGYIYNPDSSHGDTAGPSACRCCSCTACANHCPAHCPCRRLLSLHALLTPTLCANANASSLQSGMLLTFRAHRSRCKWRCATRAGSWTLTGPSRSALRTW